jgi:hypothetical protein
VPKNPSFSLEFQGFKIGRDSIETTIKVLKLSAYIYAIEYILKLKIFQCIQILYFFIDKWKQFMIIVLTIIFKLLILIIILYFRKVMRNLSKKK